MSTDHVNNPDLNHNPLQNELPSLSPSPQVSGGNSQPQSPQNDQKALTDEHQPQAFLTDDSSSHKLPAAEAARLQNNTAHDSLSSAKPSNPSNPQAQAAQKIGGHLELLEERPVVSKERVDVGKVVVTKHTRTKTVNVPIELLEEYITVQTEFSNDEQQDLLTGNYEDKDVVRHVAPTLDNKAVVTINGNQVEIGDSPVEIVISRQIATVTKDTYVVQEVNVSKTTHTHTDSVAVALQHEELEVTEEGFLSHPHR